MSRVRDSGVAGHTQRVCSISHCIGSGSTNPIGCRRTVKADIRFRLDGGPQGRNPHTLTPGASRGAVHIILEWLVHT